MINSSGSNSEYPFVAIDSFVLESFKKIAAPQLVKDRRVLPTVFRLLECFLQVTNQILDEEVLKSPKMIDVCRTFIGAIYAENFIESTLQRKYVWSTEFLKLLTALSESGLAFSIPKINLSLVAVTQEVQHYVIKFDKIQLNEEKLWLWHGWPCINKLGQLYWAPLFPIYERLGKSFTQKFHNVCREFLSSRNTIRAPCVRMLAKFMKDYEVAYTELDLQRSEFIGPFWVAFFEYFFVNEYINGQKNITTLTSEWRNHFVSFVELHLVKSGLFAETWGELPQPPINSTPGSLTHVRKNTSGELIKEKLLTDIPLKFSDEEAIHILFKQIRTDVNTAVQWATYQAKDIWDKYLNRVTISDQGQVVTIGASSVMTGKKWLVSRNNPDHLKNAATTYAAHVHVAEKANQLFPIPISQTAYELGMPVTGALTPHCIILIANHPKITPSFLNNFELFDKNGKQVGFVKGDGQCYLISKKYRNGAELAQQRITLNETTIKIVEQMIAITSSVRAFLKLQKNDDWRYLILHAVSGFSFPKRNRRIHQEFTNSTGIQKFAESLRKVCKMDVGESKRYAARFGLSALRASSAVLVYLETRSISEMSKALGHAKVESDLINRYLPAPILAFFQERWIRIFQAAILVEALKESEYLIEASGFSSIHEIDDFLKIHALKLPSNESALELTNAGGEQNSKNNEIVFGVNRTTLTLLIAIQIAVQNAQFTVHAKAKYWFEISKYLMNHLESLKTYRPDFNEYLEYAKLHANPKAYEALIYG